MVLALLGLFASSFAAATILPLASEVPLVLIVRREQVFALPVLVATSGNYLGACTTFFLARAAAARLAPAHFDQHGRPAQWFRRYGAPALFLSWVPVVGDGIVVLAGGTGVPFMQFSIWTAAGKFARYAFVAWLVLR